MEMRPGVAVREAEAFCCEAYAICLRVLHRHLAALSPARRKADIDFAAAERVVLKIACKHGGRDAVAKLFHCRGDPLQMECELRLVSAMGHFTHFDIDAD